MTPIEEILALYTQYPQPQTFEEDLAAYLRTGYVFSTPEVFLMGRAIDKNSTAELIANPWHAFPREEQNCWLVFAASRIESNIFKSKQFLQFVPYYLSWLAFQRRGKALKFYETPKLISKCTSHFSLTGSAEFLPMEKIT